MHHERHACLIYRTTRQCIDDIVGINDERIGQAKPRRTCGHVHAERVGWNERGPEQPSSSNPVIEIVDLRAILAREEIKSNKGKAALALLAVLTDVGSSHETYIVGERHTRLATVVGDCACAVTRCEPDAAVKVAYG